MRGRTMNNIYRRCPFYFLLLILLISCDSFANWHIENILLDGNGRLFYPLVLGISPSGVNMKDNPIYEIDLSKGNLRKFYQPNTNCPSLEASLSPNGKYISIIAHCFN